MAGHDVIALPNRSVLFAAIQLAWRPHRRRSSAPKQGIPVASSEGHDCIQSESVLHGKATHFAGPSNQKRAAW